MEEISIYDIDKIVKENDTTIIHVYLENSFLSDISKSVIRKVQKMLSFEDKLIYELPISSFSFEEVLPTIIVYQNGRLVEKLIGFQNSSSVFKFIKKFLQ